MLPRIGPFQFEKSVFAGEPVQITCLVTKGDRPLRISWYFHSTELTSSQTGVYTSSMGDRSNILSIPSAGLSNSGNYTCVAQNAVGMDYYSAYLEVNGTIIGLITIWLIIYILIYSVHVKKEPLNYYIYNYYTLI